ncbi:MAG: transcriptional repressor [Muribaculaceae bacterium]|nr:transcriptional repressor [Muribaculaceae bacterium]
MEEINKILKVSDISPTPIRILVYRCLRESVTPISLTDIEIALDTVDKSTISRTLNLFKNHHLIHSFNDGSGSVKYELCKCSDEFHDDEHVHFRCEQCGLTICLPTVRVPRVKIPEGYKIKDINYVITGVCNRCNNSR